VSAGGDAAHGGVLIQFRTELNLGILLCKYSLDRRTSLSMARYGGFSNAAERNLLLQVLEGYFIALSGNGHLSLKQRSQVF